jgi:membrane-associated phospholipid phosphatase
MTRSARIALACSALAALGVALGRLLAFDVAQLHHADALTLHGFMSLDRPAVHSLASAVAHVADPVPYGLIGMLLIGIAIARGRMRLAVAVAVVLLGAAVTTDYVLKPALAASRYAPELGFRQVPSGSFPSGHATASMALALCAILVAPARLRPYVAALGAAFAIAVSFAFLSLGWHYPSDVLGGYLVAAAWTGAAVAALRWNAVVRAGARRRLPPISREYRRRALVTAAAAVALVALAAIVAVLASARALDFLRVHTVFAFGAAAIAVAGVAVAGLLARLLRD